ncbi:MAG TPA: YidC/Oxa1 family membrane protein insertase [Dehalococcoidia bacterium]|nr:YidC/Oxa1 family membrane protein insertase [Dehalococcoidia bacterium]
MEIINTLWTEIIIRPMLNSLVVLYVIFFNNMGIAIIVFTILVRLLTLPLTLKQVRQMRSMNLLQPKMREIQERFKGDRARVSQETMRMYREAGVSPLGCLGPLVVQMPILIGLFRVLIQTLFTNPDDLVGLSEKLYSWLAFLPIYEAAPLNPTFLGMNLGAALPMPGSLILAFFVGGSTWVQQKMTMMPTTDPRQQSSQNMMLWMMPVFLGVFSMGWPSGLPLYWIVSNLIGVSIQYFITGWGPLFPLFPKAAPAPALDQPSQRSQDMTSEEMVEDESSRTNRTNRRRSRRTGAERARRRPQRGRGRNTK